MKNKGSNDLRQLNKGLAALGDIYKKIFEEATDAIFINDPETGMIVDCNRAYCELTGRERDELIGMHHRDLHPPEEDEGEFSGAFRRYVLVKDGTIFPVEINVKNISHGGQKFNFAVVRDISERKRAGEALQRAHNELEKRVIERTAELEELNNDLCREIEERRRTEGRLRSLEKALETTNMGVTVTDLDGKIVYTNPADAKMHGYSRKELIGKDARMFAPPEKHYNISIDQILTTKNRRRESINIRKGGAVFHVHLISDIVTGHFGEPVGIVTTCEDITERKRVEEELSRVNRALKAISQCNKAVIQARDEENFLLEICRLIVSEGGYELAWAGYAEDDKDKTVRPVAQYGDKYGYLNSIKVTWSDSELGRGPVGTSIRSADVSVVNEAITDNRFSPWRFEANRCALRSAIGLPLIINNHVLGALAIYSSESDAFNKKEVDLLKKLAKDVSFGLKSIRTDNKRKQAEEELRRSEETARAILNATTETLILIDTEGRILSVNQAGADRMGKSPGKLVGSKIYSHFPEELAKTIQPRINEVIRTGRPVHFEDMRNEYCFSNNLFPVFDKYKKVERVVIFTIDTAAQNRAEKALRTTEERYVLAMEAANDGLWDRNLDTGEVYFSPRWKKLLGYENDGLPNNREEWTKRIHPDDYDRVMGEMNNYFEGNSLYYLSEHRLRHKDGSYRWVMAKGAIVRDEEGNPTRFAGSHTDITDRKKAEEDKKCLEGQLRQAQKMETIGTLAGGIAHDFNNILTPILAYAELALEDLPAESHLHDDIEGIMKAGKRAKELVQHMLTFSRHSDQERQPLEIHLAVGEVLKMLRATLPTTIEIRQEIDTDCGAVLANPTHIDQILMNLCTNAYQAMRDKGGLLEVSLKIVKVDAELAAGHLNLKPGEYVRLSVRDTGCGMDNEVKERIFDPFFTTKGVGEGTGLGLSVVHGIVLNHEGEINVESSPGEGTVFHVFLPRVDGYFKRNIDIDDITTPKGKGQILFVDDEKEIVSLGGKMLRRLGYEVTESYDGIEALKKFSANPGKYDLIITDYTMPKMTGLHLTGEVRKIRPDISIIITSGYNEKIRQENIQEFGINEYVVKPFTIRGLGTTIRRVLDSGK